MKLIQKTLFALIILSLTSLFAQESRVGGRLVLPAEQFAAQNSYRVLIELDIQPGWHINSNEPLEDFLIPTEITFSPVEGVSFGQLNYPQAELRKFSFSDTRMAVFEGKVFALTTLTIQPDFKADSLALKANIYYQACNDESCLAPEEFNIELNVAVVAPGTAVQPINESIFNDVLSQFESETAVPQNESDRSLSDVVKQEGMVYAFIFIFLGGLALNLTPCVYPLIPITVSYFGGQSDSGRGGVIMRAVVYVLGMSITYSVLGVAASLTGGMLGSALQNPLVLIFVALVLVALSLSMFGLYEIRIPQSLALMGSKNRSGYFGTLFMGLTVGLIAAPCIGPFVLGLLTYVGDIGDPFLGFWMFFVLAMGLGTPFLVLGIFSGAMSKLPRSGAWMVWVRNMFGFILIGMAIYFLEPLIPSKTLYFILLALTAVAAGVYLGWIDKNTGKQGFMVTRNVVGVLFIALGVFLGWPSAEAEHGGIAWQHYSAEALQQAQQSGQPVIIDFYADWCLPCKELDKFTFSDPAVISNATKFVTLKADLTSFDSETTTQLREQYKIKGVPTIVFITTDGSERVDLRLIGFEDPEQFIDRMNSLKK